MEDILITNLLTKTYGRFKALENFNMRIPSKAIYGLVGKNGAGKTTLLRTICGLQSVTSGSYTLYGIDNKDKNIAKVRRKVGAVIETPGIYSDLSATDNLKVQFRIVGESSFKRIPELLKLVGLENTGRKVAKNFSLGMKQRLGLAIALANNPDFLILDEPVNGLDPQGIVDIRKLILKLNKEKGITILLSSHLLSELSHIATHYGFIDGGKMIKEISAYELEKVSRKRIIIEVSDIVVLEKVMKSLKMRYRIVSRNRAEIYSDIIISKLLRILSQQRCEIYFISEQNENLEGYYMNLIGRN